MALTAAQARALDHLRTAYVGPEDGPEEFLRDRPSLRYLVGMLFPVPPETAGEPDTQSEPDIDESVAADVEIGDVEEGAARQLAEDWQPSSVAVSFVIEGASVLCDLRTAGYDAETVDGVEGWRRTPFEIDGVELSASHPRETVTLGGRPVEIGSRWRRYGDAHLVTVSIRLLTRSTGTPRDDIPLMLFQVAPSVRPGTGARFRDYDVAKAIDLDEESREIRLRYRDRLVYAVGHGMSAGWDLEAGGGCSRIFIDPVPYAVVPAVKQTGLAADTPGGRALDVAHLERIDVEPASVVSDLRAFVASFADWAQAQTARADEARLGDDGKSIAERSVRAAERMAEGVGLLSQADSDDLRRAFSLAMKAMRMQMERARPGETARWRPFQLGFLLVSLASTVEERHPDRETVDLIWFPTGGGKTEAYLALAAIVAFLRRIRHGVRGGGTAVITRYTLRLLTAQQFQRAAALICAMELIRAEDPRADRMVPFSIGLWIGNEATPGTRADAGCKLERLLEAKVPEEANKFQISECPWCRSPLLPSERSKDASQYGVSTAGKDIVFRCLDDACEFSGDRALPVKVVDEELYEDPPTVLLATVDKFARLQFVPEAGRLLGLGTAFEQPSLIIQDELHLLSGPLGTTVAVFDAVIQLLLADGGTAPKIVASTATIRASGEQVRGLYGRSVELYPPAGLDGDETFFSKPDESGEGRLYVGLMPQSMSQAYALVATTPPLLELPQLVRDAPGIDGRDDPYWSLVMYHNSLRELGRSRTIVLDDVNGRLETRAERLDLERRQIGAEQVLELTSRRGPEELPGDLRSLGVSTDDAGAKAVDVVLASNMLSVGVDIPRLSLMLMVGQPKTTAEYIQSTSRVGRGEHRGIVVTLFRSNRARDRSHFETFRAYHDGLYRSVEPTSVTPWSLSSQERSLAGALVLLLRHSAPALSAHDDAGNFDLENPGIREASEILGDELVDLVRRADPAEVDAVRARLRRLLSEWDERAERARADGENLDYERRRARPSTDPLLKRIGEDGPGWIVGDSMRSVEPNIVIEVEEWEGAE